MTSTIKIETRTIIILAAVPATQELDTICTTTTMEATPNNTKNNFQDKPTNLQVTLTGPVNRDQLFKIQEVLGHPSQYRDKLPPNEQPAMGEYAKSFNKFCPKKVEVNKETIDEVVGFGHFMKKSDAEVTEAINLYKVLGDDIPYGPEDQSAELPQQD